MLRKTTLRKTFQSYLDGKLKPKKYQKICVFLLAIVFSGFIGWVWEFFLDEARTGFQHLYIKGGNFLPWINLYAYGALLIIPVTYKIRRRPLLVFMISFFTTGILELIAGWLVFTIGNGARYWDYTKDWWGFGNINGFVCPVSALVFAFGSIFIVYFLEPFCFFIAKRIPKRRLLFLSWALFSIVLFDDILNFTLSRLDLPHAHNYYLSLGWEIKPEAD